MPKNRKQGSRGSQSGKSASRQNPRTVISGKVKLFGGKEGIEVRDFDDAAGDRTSRSIDKKLRRLSPTRTEPKSPWRK